MDFPERLAQVLKEKGYTNYRIAKELGISPSTLANYVNGKTRPDMAKLEAISVRLGVSRNWLLTGSGEKTRHTLRGDHGGVASEMAEPGDVPVGKLITIIDKQADSIRERDEQITQLIRTTGTLVDKITPLLERLR